MKKIICCIIVGLVVVTAVLAWRVAANRLFNSSVSLTHSGQLPSSSDSKSFMTVVRPQQPDGGTVIQTSTINSRHVEDLSGIDLDSGTNASILIEDSMGRRTGRDSKSESILQEIPQSVYFEDRLDNALTGAVGVAVNHAVEVTQPSPGTYNLQLTGIDDGSYDLSARLYSVDGSPQPPIEEKGKIASGTTIAFQLDFKSTPGTISTLSRLLP